MHSMNYHITEQDIYLFHQGTNYRSQHFLGCHLMEWEGKQGFRFVVWAPNAKEISVVGDFNDWNGEFHFLERLNHEGLWVGFFYRR